ncbi:MAG TPA: choice-of-anchor D domain-containing protein, partial [Longimicrobiales bacterium]|nr:choice-of-anchor D domain-containing protein [Longimicrobiales bacterium]
LADTRGDTLAGLTAWARGVSDPQLLVQAGPALVEMASWGRRHQPEATVDLARAAHAGLYLGGAWATWSDLLSAAHGAATAPVDQAWTLHELGTRDLVHGDRAGASARLHQALELRNRIGDREGAAVTRHNLDLLEPPPGDGGDDGDGGDNGGNGHHPGRWVSGIVAAAVVAGGALYAVGLLPPDTTSPTVPPTVAPGRLEPGTDPLQLGEIVVGDETAAPWSVINHGPGSVDIEDVSVDPPFAVDQDCGTLEALDECEMTVFFAPDAPGEYQSELSVDHTGEQSPLTITVIGSAIPEPEAFITAVPGTVDFGARPVDDADRTQVEIRNDGNAPVDTVNPFLADGGFFLSESDCSSLESGESCSVVVGFPASEPGVFEDTLVVEHSGDNDTLEIPVRGEVIAPPDVIGEVVESGTAEGTRTSGDFSYYPLPVTLRISNIGGEPVPDAFEVHMETVEDGPAWIPSGPAPD